MKTTNRISHHFTDAEFLHALERTGAVKIESVPHSLTPIEPRGQLAVPEFDYATNSIHGSVKDVGPCDEQPCRRSDPTSCVVCALSFVGCVLLVAWAAIGALVWRWLR